MAEDLTQVPESQNQDHVSQLLPPMPLPHSQEDPSQVTLGLYTEQIMKILSGNFRIPKCVKENVQLIYTVAFIVKTIVLSRSRTVFLKCVVEDKCLSSAAFPS